MATTITASSLTVTITTQITLNGQAINSENQLVIPSITQFDKRIMQIPTANEATVVAFATGVAAGTFVSGNLKYLQITNKDAVNYVRIRVKKNGADTYDQRVDAGQTFIIGSIQESVSATAAAFATFQSADSINAQTYVSPVDIEYVVASI